MAIQNFDSQALKQAYHKPEFLAYGSISVLTAGQGTGTRCDNSSTAFPGCGGDAGMNKTG